MAAIPRRSTPPKRTGGRRPIPIKEGIVPGPPYNNEAERHVLGLLLINPYDVARVAEIISSDDFFDHRHRAVYDALCRIADREELPTASLVDEELKRMGKLGLVEQVFVHELLNGLNEFDDACALARVVLEDSLRRQEIGVGNDLVLGTANASLAMARMELISQRRLNQSLATQKASLGMLVEDVEAQAVCWLWHRRVARGKITMLDGDPGVGKGFLTLDIAARVSRGARLPHDPRAHGLPPANVLLFTPEDDVADTIRPRLEAAGADLHRVRFVATIEHTDLETGVISERMLSIPRDVPILEEVIMREGIELLIIDPITAVLDAGVKTNNDTEVRTALMPLATMAMRTNCAVWTVRHLNKSGGDNALYRGGGSIAFVGLARIGMMLVPHPDGDAKRVLAPVKSNIGRPGDALAFTLESMVPDGIPHVIWDDDICNYDTRTLLTTKVSDQRREIIQAIKDMGTSDCSPTDIAQALGFAGDPGKESSLRNMLVKMVRANALASPVRGRYRLPDRS